VFGGAPTAIYRIMSVRMQAFAEGVRIASNDLREPKNNAIQNEKRINCCRHSTCSALRICRYVATRGIFEPNGNFSCLDGGVLNDIPVLNEGILGLSFVEPSCMG